MKYLAQKGASQNIDDLTKVRLALEDNIFADRSAIILKKVEIRKARIAGSLYLW